MSNFTAISYLVSSVLFILALKGLSSPTTSRQGNVYGMVGMALAVITTFLVPSFKPVYWLIGGAIIAGAIIGSIAAQRVQMTKMPELVALMHSFVGLSAVLIALLQSSILLRPTAEPKKLSYLLAPSLEQLPLQPLSLRLENSLVRSAVNR